jgi:type I restriction-modification system DNA methylase subunit
MTSAAIVQKLWNYCNVLRDDGMSYGDYVEQLTYLLFRKLSITLGHLSTEFSVLFPRSLGPVSVY